MRALKVTILVVAVAATALVSGGWIIGKKAPVAPGEMYIGPETSKTLDFLEKNFGLSRTDAIDYMHRVARQHGPDDRIVDRLSIPPGAQVDFIEVDGTKVPNRVRYLGSARALAADSADGQAFYALYRQAARRNHWYVALSAMENLRARGTVLAPAWFGGVSQVANAAVGATGQMLVKPQVGSVKLGATGTRVKPMAASTYRVAVVCAQFPAWIDKSPYSQGAQDYGQYVDAQGVLRHYVPTGPRTAPTWPIMDPATPPDPEYRNIDTGGGKGYAHHVTLPLIGGMWLPGGAIDWYLDSPGGRMTTNSGVPLGTAAVWADEHPWRLPDIKDGPAGAKLQAYWFRRLFDINFTGDPTNDIGRYIGSLASYYWDQSFGNVSITGTPTDIYGWISSRHLLDRRKNQQGSPFYVIQPGTPIIRPSPDIVTADGVDRPILRAAIGNYAGTIKLTVLYKYDYIDGSSYGFASTTEPPWPTITLWQLDTSSEANDQNGYVIVPLSQYNTIRVVDPYDRRRWTYISSTWQYIDTKPGGTAARNVVIYNPNWYGGTWSASWPAHGPVIDSYDPGLIINSVPAYTWQSGVSGFAGQDLGCGTLPDTTFDSTETLGSIPGTRMKSFDYYCHDHYMNASRGPYQISHLLHGGYYDDISGDSEPSWVRVPRPFPLDCGLPGSLGGSDAMQLGYFHYLNNNNEGGHSSGEMEGDSYQAMADQNIVMNGPYQRSIFIFAGGGAEEGSNPGAWGTIIAHASGGSVTVGEDCGLGTMAHEVGHTLGFGDLYDGNFYTNSFMVPPPYPKYFECDGMNQYSVMAMGGTRVDPGLLVANGWVDAQHLINCTTDNVNALLPQMENPQRNPRVYKFPANPYDILTGAAPSAWNEFFLMEFRGQGFRGNANTGWWGDPVPRGVYIYRINGNFGQTVQNLDYSWHPEGYVTEQADGLRELENNLSGATGGGLLQFYPGTTLGPGNLFGDAFGVDAPPTGTVVGAASNHDFTQWAFNLKQYYANQATLTYVPTSNSQGLYDGSGHMTPGTDTDSFSRVLNIQINGASPNAYVTADIYVTPHEVVATGVEVWPTVDANVTPLVWQGQANVPVMKLILDNQDYQHGGDYSRASMGEVTIRALRILQSGSSGLDTDVSLVKLWDIKDTGRPFNPTDPTQCTLLASTTLAGKVASFGTPDPTVRSDMNYSIILGATRTLYLTYDIGVAAQVNPQVTVAADLPEPRYLWPQPPGAVQIKTRNATQFSFGVPRFPIQTANTATILDGTDTVFISATNLAPSTVKPSDKNVGVLAATLSVDHDQATVHSLHFVAAPTGAPLNAQRDVAKAILWQDKNGNGVIDTGTDTKITEAVFSTTNELVFDNIDLVVKGGTPIPLLVGFDIASDPAAVGDWLQLQLTGAGDVNLLDEDGPGNTIYRDPADATHFADVAHGANPATWTLVAGMDQVAASGAPWKSSDFKIIPPSLPLLSKTAGQATLTPTWGDRSTTFNFRITYTSTNNFKPKFIKLVYRVPNATSDTIVDMAEVNPSDVTYTDGKDFIAPVTGLTTFGKYRYYFWANDGATDVYYYAPATSGGGTGTEGSYYSAPRDLGDYLFGPQVNSPSKTEFFSFTDATNRRYEEGRTLVPATPGYQLIYVRVTDIDQSTAGLIGHVTVNIKGSGASSDSEDVLLTEVDASGSGIFEGSLPTYGKTGASNDGVLNAIAGPTGQQITATYKDKNDVPIPGAIDTSTDTAAVIDTTPPEPIPAAMLTATVDPAGTSIVLDWTGYEATQIDVAGYRVYAVVKSALFPAPFTDVTGLTPTATLAAGAHSYTVPTTTENIYYLAVCPFDEVPNMWKKTSDGVVVLTRDTDHNAIPFIVNLTQSPARNATGVLLTAHVIQAQVQDTGSGIDTTDPAAIALMVTADDGSGSRAVAGVTAPPTPGSTLQDPVAVRWTAAVDWHWNDVVTVHLVVKDKAGNILNTDDLPSPPNSPWTFSVISDSAPPTLDLTSLVPANGATLVPTDQVVTFRLKDDGSGVDLTTIHVQLKVDNPRLGTIGVWTDVAVGTTPNAAQTDVLCRYPAVGPGAWQYDDQVHFRVQASDRLGHADAGWLPSDAGWGFDLYTAAAGLSIPDSSLIPANGATNVPLVGTTIEFNVLDSIADINPATITLTVDGVPIPWGNLVITGTVRNYHVKYTPPPPVLKVNESHSCIATASDLAANSTTSGPWTWYTVHALPTFTLITPANTSIPVPVTSSIVVRIAGVNSNIDPATITMTVTADGNPVTGVLTKSSAVPAPTIDATFQATPQLPGSAAIAVHVEASDVAPPVPNHGTADFNFGTAPAPTYTIVGRITNSAGGGAVSALQVNLTGAASASTNTDGNGYYQFRNLLAGSYTVTPPVVGWTFAPDHRDITLSGNVNNADFTATQIAFALKGHVTRGGNGLAGVTVSTGTRSATTTSPDGAWQITGVVPGDYVVTPTFIGHTFTPASLPAHVTTADVTGLDFAAIALTYTISGTISDNNGNRMIGVTVRAGSGTDTTHENGRYEIGGVPTGTVSVQVSKTGWLFFWQDAGGVSHMAPEAVSVPPDRPDTNFTGFPVTTQAFGVGFHMIGVPLTPRDISPVSVFGTNLVARWDPVTSPPYLTVNNNPGAELLNVLPGRGFWVYFTAPVNLQVAGTPVSTSTGFPLATADGWNMLANPFTNQLPFGNIAVISGSVRPFAYVYNPASDTGYDLIATMPGVGIARSYILPWEAMWIRSIGSSSLTATAAVGGAAADDVKALQLDLGSAGWSLPVAARVGPHSDRCCAVGVLATGSAINFEKPPAISNSVDVSVLSATGDRLARSILPAGKTRYEWDLLVTTDIPDADVSVSLPDLSKVPSSLRVTLTDLDAGKSIYMRTTEQYTFHADAAGAQRHFHLTVEQASTAGLVISAASAQASGSRVTITYTASAPCSVTARVLNIAGRPVRVLASGSPAAAGVNALSWDGRGASGSLVPAGLYLVELDAVADNGQRVRTVTQLNLSGRR